jgi:hypothetical protein
MSETKLMRYVEAPNPYSPDPWSPPAVFLAGGITGCPRWHDDARAAFRAAEVPVVVLNPNRVDFPIHDPDAGEEQVRWEQRHLHLPHLITMMWFPASDPAVTTQPIAMFEFGQAIGEGRRLVVGADPGYPRVRDVHLLMLVNRPGQKVHGTLAGLVEETVALVRAASR